MLLAHHAQYYIKKVSEDPNVIFEIVVLKELLNAKETIPKKTYPEGRRTKKFGNYCLSLFTF